MLDRLLPVVIRIVDVQDVYAREVQPLQAALEGPHDAFVAVVENRTHWRYVIEAMKYLLVAAAVCRERGCTQPLWRLRSSRDCNGPIPFPGESRSFQIHRWERCRNN